MPKDEECTTTTTTTTTSATGKNTIGYNLLPSNTVLPATPHRCRQHQLNYNKKIQKNAGGGLGTRSHTTQSQPKRQKLNMNSTCLRQLPSISNQDTPSIGGNRCRNCLRNLYKLTSNMFHANESSFTNEYEQSPTEEQHRYTDQCNPRK